MHSLSSVEWMSSSSSARFSSWSVYSHVSRDLRSRRSVRRRACSARMCEDTSSQASADICP